MLEARPIVVNPDMIVLGFRGFSLIAESFIGLIEDGFEGVSEFIVVDG